MQEGFVHDLETPEAKFPLDGIGLPLETKWALPRVEPPTWREHGVEVARRIEPDWESH